MIQSVRESIVYHCEGEGEGVKGDRIGWNAMEGDPICSIYSSLAQRARQGPAVLGLSISRGSKSTLYQARRALLRILFCFNSSRSSDYARKYEERRERDVCEGA